ncbi:MAG: tRNA (adenosine(37)-N6)-threonylcarbamoyltransferase complex ATPase subunit type 1 TsaE [Deltaproteobacteria bacterium]|nr:tRNA (adenosine(37)-N6)-threonylcarbamoyltransferase complex ATPase subunit type 1 TsaE [Deltaproteobacteria bacterium]
MKTNSMRYRTESPEETVLLGRRLGRLLQPGDLVVLAGELGCGKTWFTKGIALGVGVLPHEVVTSPSFALMNEYEGRITLFHMDVYRLEKLQDFLDTGLDECFDGRGIVVMEWGDRWPEILPERRLNVGFSILGEQTRELEMTGEHPRTNEIFADLKLEI